jgi:hypothetical protein
MDLNWAMKYMMGLPDTIHLRCVFKKDFPNAGDHAYVCIPYDMEKGVCIPQVGMLTIKAGNISPNPEHPDKCILTTVDNINPGKMMPDFALKAIMKK